MMAVTTIRSTIVYLGDSFGKVVIDEMIIIRSSLKKSKLVFIRFSMWSKYDMMTLFLKFVV